MEAILLNFTQVAEDFIRLHLPESDTESSNDILVVQAVGDPGMNPADRQQRLLKWLHDYRVFLGFPHQARENVVARVLEFADSHRNTAGSLSKDDIVRYYHLLVECIQTAAPPDPKTQKVREVRSLSSKALWCCFPDDVPMMDGYACRALQVMSRLAGLKPGAGQKEYASFVDVWLQLYEQIRPVLDGADSTKHPYKVRVFDRLLWYLGQPSFN